MMNSNFNRRIVKSRFLSGKNITVLFAILFAAGLNSSRAQDTWTQKADFGGTARWAAVGFSIDNKGYVGTGATTINHNDFWEFDPATNVWTQKADFAGGARSFAVGFAIGSKGYLGTGSTSVGDKNDFWEYDPSTNIWTQKANYGGGDNGGAVGFSIGNKGYIGTGNDSNDNLKKDFWEYDPSTNAWTKKADFGGTARKNATGFSIGSKGYIGIGGKGSTYENDFWEYDPANNSWTQKANFGGSGRYFATGLSIGNKGYIGTGQDSPGSYKKDFWEYNPDANVWTQKADFAGTARQLAVGLYIGDKGYIGGGGGINFENDFWEYTPGTSSCAVPTNLSATNITSTSAKLNWDAVPGAEGYKIHYKASGTNPWIAKNSNGNSKNLNNLSPNTSYIWQVKTFCTINPGFSSDWSAKQKFTTGSSRIGDKSLHKVSFQIYPNPAEDHATIQFTLPQSSHVYIRVYEVSGKEIEALSDAELEQGEHSLQLNTNHFPKGVYMVKMICDFGIENQKLIVQ